MTEQSIKESKLKMTLLEELKSLLKKDSRLVSEDKLLKNRIVELALKLDKDLIKLLLGNAKIRGHFFTEVDKILVFDKEKFMKFIDNKEFLPDSYTAFKNKIGLTADGNYIAKSKEVVLSWPYKDCILEGGQEKTDEKRKEIFHNEILAPDEIDRLLEPKVFTKFKRIDAKGEHPLDGFRRCAEINRKRGLPKDTITDNLIIKGNNLLVLHSLLKEFRGKVKLIYIDPPYNTGSDEFRYNDNFNHSTWLTFMKNRLEVAKELLKDEGVIFVSIDEGEQAYLKVLCDEIFDRENFINIISIKTGESLRAIGGGESTRLKKKAEFITLYAKNKNSFIPNPVYEFTPLQEIIESKKRESKNFEYNQVLVSEGDKEPFNKFMDGYGDEIIIYKHKNYTIESLNSFMGTNTIKSEMEVYERFNNKVIRLALSESSILKKVQEKTDQGLYSIEYKPRTGRKRGKLTRRFFYKQNEIIFLSEVVEKVNGVLYHKEKLSNLWIDISWQGIMKEGGVSLKYGKKPEKLLQRIIEFSTNEGDLVLDFFMGTGTTCAVAHKMGRQYIGVEQLDYGENSAAVRLKNVIGKANSKEKLVETIEDYDTTGISKDVGWKGGGDFVYCELMELNERFIQKIQAAKNTDELLKSWEAMKKHAFLSYKIEPKHIDKNVNNFKELSFENQKMFLIEVLDKNDLYVNFSEIEDKQYGVTIEDIELNKKFYQKRCLLK